MRFALLVLLAPHEAAAAIDNCIAGGAGYAVAFDGLDGTTISMKWDDAPTEKITVEYWALLTDPHVRSMPARNRAPLMIQ